jgi:hypothetical protein
LNCGQWRAVQALRSAASSPPVRQVLRRQAVLLAVPAAVLPALAQARQAFGLRAGPLQVERPVRRPLHQEVEAHRAEVAPAPLEQGHGGRGLERARQLRNVLGQDLLLQRHGGGADDQLDAALARQQQAGRQVGARLSHTGAGLDHQGAQRRLRLVEAHRLQLRGNGLQHGALTLARRRAGNGGDQRVVKRMKSIEHGQEK